MVYNMTGFGNATNLFTMFEALNTASGGLVGALSLIVIFAVILAATLRNNPPPEAFLAASMPSFVMAVLFAYLQIVSELWLFGFLIIGGAALIALYRSNSV